MPLIKDLADLKSRPIAFWFLSQTFKLRPTEEEQLKLFESNLVNDVCNHVHKLVQKC